MTPGTRELTCRELAEFLGDYFARDLAPATRATFERHLVECPDCVAYLQNYAAAIRFVKDAYDDDRIPAEVPDELVRAVLEARRRLVRSPLTRSVRSRRPS